MLNPTWCKLSIGPYLRQEKDKRHYFGLFESYGITGLRKFWAIHHVTHEEKCIENFLDSKGNAVLRVAGLGNYFQDLDQKLVHDYFWKIASPTIIRKVNEYDYSNTIAMHVRLGDYTISQRTSMDWYEQIGREIGKYDKTLQILLFSDGTDEELAQLLRMKNVKRAPENNALTDMLSISKCKAVVASDSTFSAMGAFIGNRPIIFPRKFPSLYNDDKKECVLSSTTGSDVINIIIRSSSTNGI